MADIHLWQLNTLILTPELGLLFIPADPSFCRQLLTNVAMLDVLETQNICVHANLTALLESKFIDMWKLQEYISLPP